MKWKAEFVLADGFASFFIEIHGGYNYAVAVANHLAQKLDAQFTGCLEEVK